MSSCAACDKQITDRSTIVTFGSSKYHPRCAASDPRDAELATLREQLADAMRVVEAARAECAKFRFPDEDRPELHEALRDYDAKHGK